MSAERTPTPWAAVPSEGHDEEWEVVTPFPGLPGEYLWVASCSGMGHEYGSPQGNAAFIVLAVNSHDELVAALKGLLKSHRPGRGQCCDEADAALDVLAKVEPRIPDIQIKGAA